MEKIQPSHKIIIIGGGPAAWTAALYTARADLHPLVLSGENSGGQLMLTTVVENFPGFVNGIEGPQLMQGLRDQAERFGAKVIEEKVIKVRESGSREDRQFEITTQKNTYLTEAVIVATGAEAVWLNVPGEKEFLGKGVSTCAVCDAAFFRNKTTVVVGGGDAAMEDALQLTKFAQKVIVVHRRDSFRASKVMAERVLNHPKISVMWNSKIDRIEGDGLLRQVVISNEATGKNNLLKVDGLFIAIGHKPTTEFVNGFLELNDGYIKVGITNFPITPQQIQVHDMWKKGYPTMTSKEGVFAAGDCVDFRYRQAAVAAGMGIMAALDAQWWLEE